MRAVGEILWEPWRSKYGQHPLVVDGLLLLTSGVAFHNLMLATGLSKQWTDIQA